ncbi:hypothetical protein EYZ11_006115 [Aspergillus tanneri]|uniref:Hydrophobic surface binding protein A-domain-containing protein n=1 Tax=Aspergillus tanneri TaxID=1220188 RepID=A0A4S3JIS8_9EURO|nr:hypothetical protein EYZ11_006115 [Aspergillus tanneri]
MHFHSVFTLILALLFTLVGTSSVLPRDATAVQQDLDKLSTDVKALTSAITSYTGGVSGALEIQNKEQTVEGDLDKVTTDAKAASTFTESESSTITKSVLGLEPDIKTSLDTLVQKKQLIVSAGVTDIVKGDLQKLKSKTDSMSTELQAKATATDKDTLASKTKDLDAAFESALAQFS